MNDIQEKIKELSTQTILICEDEPKNLKIISGFFDKLGLNYITATDGKEAIEQLKIYSVDILLTDLNMPNMSGLELIEQINDMDNKPVIIIMTAHRESERITKAEELGCDFYLVKPIDFMQFIQLAHSTIKRI